jgi:hypothetical protein
MPFEHSIRPEAVVDARVRADKKRASQGINVVFFRNYPSKKEERTPVWMAVEFALT